MGSILQNRHADEYRAARERKTMGIKERKINIQDRVAKLETFNEQSLGYQMAMQAVYDEDLRRLHGREYNREALNARLNKERAEIAALIDRHNSRLLDLTREGDLRAAIRRCKEGKGTPEDQILVGSSLAHWIGKEGEAVEGVFND